MNGTSVTHPDCQVLVGVAPSARKSSSGHGSRHRAGAVVAEVPR